MAGQLFEISLKFTGNDDETFTPKSVRDLLEEKFEDLDVGEMKVGRIREKDMEDDEDDDDF